MIKLGEKIKTSNSEKELKLFYEEIKIDYSNNSTLLKTLLKKIYDLDYFELFNNIYENSNRKGIKQNFQNEYIFCLLETNHFKKIISIFENSKIHYKNLKLEKTTLLNIAIAYRSLSNHKKAIEILEKIKKPTTEHYIELAENYKALTNFNKSESIYIKLAKSNITLNKLHALFNLGQLQIINNKKEELNKTIKKCENLIYKIEGHSYKATWLFLLGLFYENINRKGSAKNYYKLSFNTKATLLTDINHQKKAKAKLKLEGRN